MRISALLAGLLLMPFVGRADAGQLLASFGTHISRVAPTTGELEIVALTGLDTRVNFQFIVDTENHVGYEIGRAGGVNSLSTIDLVAGSAQVIAYPGPLKLAIYNGQLLAASNQDIFLLDPRTGSTTPFGSTGYDTGINFQFTIDSDNDVAYLLGTAAGQRVLSTVDLTTGTPQVIPFHSVGAFALYRDELLITNGREISVLDPGDGSSTTIAVTGLETSINFQFTVDSDLDTAYLLGKAGGVRSLCSVDLTSGRPHIVPLEGGPTLQAYLIPLPPTATSIGQINIQRLPDAVILTTTPAFGRTIGAEFSADLSEGSWISLGNFFKADGVATFSDPDPLRRALPTGYYRAFLRPLGP